MFKTLRDKIFGGNWGSKNQAKNRLQFVLVQDRAGLKSDELARFKREIMTVVQKYFVIDEKGFDISYKRISDTTTLLINSPILVRRQDVPKGAAVGAKNNSNNNPNKNNNQAREDRKAINAADDVKSAEPKTSS